LVLFVAAVQYLTELRISLQRIDRFLSMPEPPPPVHHRVAAATGSAAAEGGDVVSSALPVGTVALRGADYDWNSNVQIHVPHSLDSHKSQKQKDQHFKGAKQKSKAAADGEGGSSNGELGSDGKAVVNGSSGVTGGPTLKGIRLELHPGELLGVAGEVGSGKSSLLAALIGELQPVRGPEGSRPGGRGAGWEAGRGSSGVGDEVVI
jgi:ABC-type multidrug transport system fused ATPase/permease subunit